MDVDAVHNEAIISIYPFYDADTTIQSYLFKLLPTVTQYGDTKNAIKGKTLNDTSICNLLINIAEHHARLCVNSAMTMADFVLAVGDRGAE